MLGTGRSKPELQKEERRRETAAHGRLHRKGWYLNRILLPQAQKRGRGDQPRSRNGTRWCGFEIVMPEDQTPSHLDLQKPFAKFDDER
ncbi:uncharacterized protein LOC120756762 isoform X2 [Hirundo rustica]|uniref:uncharacterized protein LOC120756762 isoform X2 n=1 Tax=Hirundo rustica TaxID=43150 RepID=UPI002670EE7E|nr:uncharacterized protein LOC120756762 isoform X2 [Hirundo rustica]